MFTFCSGYFYKPDSENSVTKYIIKKVKSLLVPLYVYTVIYGVIVQVLKKYGFTMGEDLTLKNVLIMPIINGHQFIYNMGGWFIIPLFMVELYNILLRKLLKSIKIYMPEIIFFIINAFLGMLGGILAIQLSKTGHLWEWWLALVRMLYFIPFYGFGIFYKNVLEQYVGRISGLWYFILIFTSKLIIIFIYEKSPVYTPSWCNDFTEGPIIPIIIGYLGILFWIKIVAILEPALGRNKYINLIADNTYSIMMNQFLGFMLVKTIFALLSRYTPAFEDFDWVNYKTNIWWYYMPKGIMHTGILYVFAGIAVPIIMKQAFCSLSIITDRKFRKNSIKKMV